MYHECLAGKKIKAYLKLYEVRIAEIQSKSEFKKSEREKIFYIERNEKWIDNLSYTM
jgi:hypothetical protein